MTPKTTIYCYIRKSTDEKGRQNQSEETQLDQCQDAATRNGVVIPKGNIIVEKKSAKAPGRPLFNELMKIVEANEHTTIYCWTYDRLCRNPLDSGTIQWFLQNGKLTVVMPGKSYDEATNSIITSVDGGQGTQYSRDNGYKVKDGMFTKTKKGWRPQRPPLGYLPDKIHEQGEKEIFVDEERFPLVRKMWDYLLTGRYTVPELVKIVNHEWGFKTRPTPKRPSKPLSIGTAYKVLTNQFYTGSFEYNGLIYEGNHKAMITPEEFDLAQKILGRAGRPRPKNKRLPFTGIIQCGECGASVSAYEKTKTIKATGKLKVFRYHRCSSNPNKKPCSQEQIEYGELVTQVKVYLDSITIPEEFLQWAIEVLREQNKIEETDREKIIKNHHDNYQACIERIQNLVNLYISPENANREMLTEEEFKSQKNTLMKEKAVIQDKMQLLDTGIDQWVELTEKTFNFATYAKAWFDKGDFEQKTNILRALGQNFSLTDKKLSIELRKPFLVLKQGLESHPLKNGVLELIKTPPRLVVKPKEGDSTTQSFVWSG